MTEFQFSTFPVASVCLFSARWPWSAAAHVIAGVARHGLRWRPNPSGLIAFLPRSPGASTPALRVGGVWAGTVADAEAQLAALVKVVGPPTSRPSASTNTKLRCTSRLAAAA